MYGVNGVRRSRGYVRRVLSDIDEKLVYENYEVRV